MAQFNDRFLANYDLRGGRSKSCFWGEGIVSVSWATSFSGQSAPNVFITIACLGDVKAFISDTLSKCLNLKK